MVPYFVIIGAILKLRKRTIIEIQFEMVFEVSLENPDLIIS